MFKVIFFEPLYNAMMWLVGVMPGGSVALAVIALTIIVKLILSPLQAKALKSQVIQKKLQPEMTRIRAEYKDPKEQSQKIMDLYKKFKTNPFSGCLVILIQLPIIFALYRVFLQDLGSNIDLLYSFVQIPETINNIFLGMNLAEKSIIFAALAAISQFTQMWFSPAMKTDDTPEKTPIIDVDTDKKPDFAQSFGKNMQKQMKYMMPIFIFFIGLVVPGAISLYFIITSLFTFAQEMIIKKKLDAIELSIKEKIEKAV